MIRNFARPLLALALTLGVVGSAAAQSKYPDRPVRVIVPFGAGGLADVSIRLVAEKLSKNMGQQFVIENIPGAGGIAAANEVLKAPADGHALIVISNGTAISEALFAKLPYSTVKDMAPVSTVAWFDMMAVTNAKGPYNTMQDFVAAARAKPGALNIGTINPGSTQHLSAELLKSLAKVPISSRVDPALLRPADVTLQIPSTEKFENATGWKPQFSFEESVAFLLDHWRREVAKEVKHSD